MQAYYQLTEVQSRKWNAVMFCLIQKSESTCMA